MITLTERTDGTTQLDIDGLVYSVYATRAEAEIGLRQLQEEEAFVEMVEAAIGRLRVWADTLGIPWSTASRIVKVAIG